MNRNTLKIRGSPTFEEKEEKKKKKKKNLKEKRKFKQKKKKKKKEEKKRMKKKKEEKKKKQKTCLCPQCYHSSLCSIIFLLVFKFHWRSNSAYPNGVKNFRTMCVVCKMVVLDICGISLVDNPIFWR
ncbi:hypothetical protein M8J75_016277 [Diaphorina citri]|nr:hypothetical protein M8J75_016277 [Diaphorina citri]